MTNQDEKKKKFCQTMLSLGEYYNRELSIGVIEIYWQGLQRFDVDAIEVAMNRHISNPDSGHYMPKVSDLVRMIEGTTKDSSVRAWSLVEQGLQRVGTYSDIVFADPVIHRVIYDMGGWIGFGRKSVDEWPFVAKEFQERYRGYRSRSVQPPYPKVLSGICNGTNRGSGFSMEPPVYFGDKEACRAVEKGGGQVPDAVTMEPAAQRFIASLMDSKQVGKTS